MGRLGEVCHLGIEQIVKFIYWFAPGSQNTKTGNGRISIPSDFQGYNCHLDQLEAAKDILPKMCHRAPVKSN